MTLTKALDGRAVDVPVAGMMIEDAPEGGGEGSVIVYQGIRLAVRESRAAVRRMLEELSAK